MIGAVERVRLDLLRIIDRLGHVAGAGIRPFKVIVTARDLGEHLTCGASCRNGLRRRGDVGTDRQILIDNARRAPARQRRQIVSEGARGDLRH